MGTVVLNTVIYGCKFSVGFMAANSILQLCVRVVVK